MVLVEVRKALGVRCHLLGHSRPALGELVSPLCGPLLQFRVQRIDVSTRRCGGNIAHVEVETFQALDGERLGVEALV